MGSSRPVLGAPSRWYLRWSVAGIEYASVLLLPAVVVHPARRLIAIWIVVRLAGRFLTRCADLLARGAFASAAPARAQADPTGRRRRGQHGDRQATHLHAQTAPLTPLDGMTSNTAVVTHAADSVADHLSGVPTRGSRP